MQTQWIPCARLGFASLTRLLSLDALATHCDWRQSLASPQRLQRARALLTDSVYCTSVLASGSNVTAKVPPVLTPVPELTYLLQPQGA